MAVLQLPLTVAVLVIGEQFWLSYMMKLLNRFEAEMRLPKRLVQLGLTLQPPHQLSMTAVEHLDMVSAS